MYELSTVRPHVPPGRRYTRAEWAPYCEGYYQALVITLRVMRVAFTNWKDRSMREKPTDFWGQEIRTSGAPAEPDELRDPWAHPLLMLLGTAVAIFMVEVLVLLAVLIRRAVQ